MATITTLSGFKTYIKRMLGAPVLQIELADVQLEQVIEDSIQLFQKYHSGEGNYKDYIAMTITSGTSAYSTSAHNLAGVIDADLTFSNDGINVLFSTQNSLLYRDWVINGNFPGSTGPGMVLTNYEIVMQYLEDINDYFTRNYHAHFSESRQEIRLVPTPNASGVALITVYRKETAANLYNNDLVKRLAVAKTKILWGSTLKKYTANLPSGATFNGQAIFDEGKEELERVMEDIKGESTPIDFFID